MNPKHPDADQDAIRSAVKAVYDTLFEHHAQGLDPVGRAYDALERACFKNPSAWQQFADALDRMMRDAPENTLTMRSIEALRKLASELENCCAREASPSPAAWADMVEFAATELASKDLEREDGRHTRIVESFRNQLRQRRRERPPIDWSWESLTRDSR